MSLDTIVLPSGIDAAVDAPDLPASRIAYAGSLTPRRAHALLEAGDAVLIDVRTEPEWLYVGRVPLGLHVEWRAYGASAPNPRFADELAREVGRDATLIFMCRSGHRSHEAATAAAAAGFSRVYNLLGGFEGALDDEQRRNRVDGWRHAGLPWVQS